MEIVNGDDKVTTGLGAVFEPRRIVVAEGEGKATEFIDHNIGRFDPDALWGGEVGPDDALALRDGDSAPLGADQKNPDFRRRGIVRIGREKTEIE